MNVLKRRIEKASISAMEIISLTEHESQLYMGSGNAMVAFKTKETESGEAEIVDIVYLAHLLDCDYESAQELADKAIEKVMKILTNWHNEDLIAVFGMLSGYILCEPKEVGGLNAASLARVIGDMAVEQARQEGISG